MQKNSIYVNGQVITGRTISLDEDGLKVDGKLVDPCVAVRDKKNQFVNEYDVETEDLKVKFDADKDGLAETLDFDDTSDWDDEDFDDDFDDEEVDVDFDEEYRKYKKKKRVKLACIIGGACALLGSAVTAAYIYSKKNK